MKFFKVFCIVIVIVLFFSKITTKVESQSGCLTAGFYVEDTFYNFFDPTRNPDSAQTFDQWIAKEMATWTQILQSSGARDCFQVGEIVHVRDGALPLAGGAPTNNPNNNDRTVDVIWGYPATELTKDSGSLAYWTDKVKGNTDWGLIHELSHARYLIDQYSLDIPNSSEVVQVTGPNGQSIINNYITPRSNNLLYVNKTSDLMADHFTYHFYGPHDVGALNRIAGQHLAGLYGNYNSPSNLGVFLNDLPNNNILRILDNTSSPILGAQIRIFNSVYANNPLYLDGGKVFDNNSDFTGTTDMNGMVSIGSNPFGGAPSPVGSNLDFILEVSLNNSYFYKILEISDFNLAYWAGATSQATYDIATTLGTALPTSTPIPTSTPTSIPFCTPDGLSCPAAPNQCCSGVCDSSSGNCAGITPTPTSTSVNPIPIAPAFNDISSFPRPNPDTGIGIHWSAATGSGYDTGSATTAVCLLRNIGVTWVKVVTDAGGALPFTQVMKQNNIEPIVRLYRGQPNPGTLRQVDLDAVTSYVNAGVSYFEPNNEPNLQIEWSGSIPSCTQAAQITMQNWVKDAVAIQQRGGFPLFPALSPGGDCSGNQDDDQFLRDSFDWLRNNSCQLANGNAGGCLDLFDAGPSNGRPAVMSVHNYNLNHDNSGNGVSINFYTQDSDAFLKFTFYDNIIKSYLGRSVPILSTEGGIIIGNADDSRFPATDANWHRNVTAAMANYQMNNTYPAFFNTAFWLSTPNPNSNIWGEAPWFNLDLTPRLTETIAALVALPKKTRDGTPYDNNCTPIVLTPGDSICPLSAGYLSPPIDDSACASCLVQAADLRTAICRDNPAACSASVCNDINLASYWCNGGYGESAKQDCQAKKSGVCQSACNPVSGSQTCAVRGSFCLSDTQCNDGTKACENFICGAKNFFGLGFGSCISKFQPPPCNPDQVTMRVSENPVVAFPGKQITFFHEGPRDPRNNQGGLLYADTWSPGGILEGANCNCTSYEIDKGRCGFTGNKTCAIASPGFLTWTHFWKTCSDNSCTYASADVCSKSVTIQVNPADTPIPAPPPCGSNVNNAQCQTQLGIFSVSSPQEFIRSLMVIVFGIAGLAALALMGYSSYTFITSSGSEEKIAEARQRLTAALFGLLFIVFSVLILQVIGVDILRIPGITR